MHEFQQETHIGPPITALQRLLRMLKAERKILSYIFLYALFIGAINLTIPLGIQAILNFIQGGAVSASWWMLIMAVSLGTLVAGIFMILQLGVNETLQKAIFVKVSFDFARRLQIMKTEYMRSAYMPELANRFFDTLTIQKDLPKFLIDLSGAVLQILFGLVLLSFYHPFFIFFGFLLSLVLFLIFRLTYATGLRSSLSESKYKYQVAHWLEEIARAAYTFKMSGNSPLPLARTDEWVQKYLEYKARHFTVLSGQFGAMAGFKTLMTFLLLALGGYLVIQNEINLGQFVAAELIILLILSSSEKLMTSMERFYDILTALEKIGAIADIPIENNLGIPFHVPDKNRGMEVQLEDITYTFSDQETPVLRDVSLHIRPGERICIAGYNGAGKTTLIQLIAGLLNIQRGNVRYNGIPRYNYQQESLRRHIGEYSSMDDIFSGTLQENIDLGFPDISLEELISCCQDVGLMPYIQSQPYGFDTPLLPQGKNLSRSTISKIILARCIISKPQLIAIEDFFVHIGQRDRQQIISLLTDRTKPWTLIAISDDLDFAMKCDRILIMKEGRILAEGPYESLRQWKDFHQVFKSSD